MSLHETEALAELARLCSDARSRLPASGFHRLRVLLDMLLVELAREDREPKPRPGPARPPAPPSRPA